jgi:hypothetical protein
MHAFFPVFAREQQDFPAYPLVRGAGSADALQFRGRAMLKALLVAAVVAASFCGSILASATPAAAFLRFDFVSVGTADMDEDDDDF